MSAKERVMFMKRLVMIITAVCIALSGFCVYAENAADKQTIGTWVFSGKLFYCDTPTNRVVLKSVAPVLPSIETAQLAREAEYLEISIAPGGLRMNDGSLIGVEDLNSYVDSNVWFVMTKAADGCLAIPYLRFR